MYNDGRKASGDMLESLYKNNIIYKSKYTLIESINCKNETRMLR